MSNITLGFILTIISGFTTLLGTIIIYIFPKKNNNIISASLAFASGVMISVSLIDLLPQSISFLKNSLYNFPSLIICLIFVLIGIILSYTIDKFLPESSNPDKQLYNIGIISMLAIILHNIPEGIATFMATNTTISLGLSLAIAISFHNIPEGISISVPIYYGTNNKRKAFKFVLISALSEPLGAFIAYSFIGFFINNFVMGILFSIIAGIMLHISCYELLPKSLDYHNKKLSLLFFLIGFLFMYIGHMMFSI